MIQTRAGGAPAAAGRLKGTEIAAVFIGLAFLATLISIESHRVFNGINDYLQLYSGAKLSGTGQLYSPEAVKRIQLANAGVWLEGVYYSRLPFYAFLLQPLALLPYRASYAVYQAMSLAAVLGFFCLYAPRCRDLIVYGSLCIPLLSVFAAGQDVSFVLLLAGASLLLSERGKDYEAGVLLSLCAIKPHLFLLWPVAVLLHRKWRVLAGAAAGGAVLLALSYIAGGPDWPAQYLELLRNPELHPGGTHMPNIHGMLLSLGFASPRLEVAVSILVAALTVAAMIRVGRYDAAAVLSLTGGLLIGFHGYTQDVALMLLVFAVLIPITTSKAVRLLAAFALLPPLSLLLLTGAPLSTALPACLIGLLAAAAIAPRMEVAR